MTQHYWERSGSHAAVAALRLPWLTDATTTTARRPEAGEHDELWPLVQALMEDHRRLLLLSQPKEPTTA